MRFALVRAPSQSYLQVSFIPNMSPSPGFRLGRGRRDGREVLPRRVGARLVGGRRRREEGRRRRRDGMRGVRRRQRDGRGVRVGLRGSK